MHPFFHHINKDVKALFRDNDDIGETRKKSTPAPEVILHNIEKFEKKWEAIHFNGWVILTPSVITQLENIIQHVHKGFLSDIPVGHGTNKNEAIHKQLKALLHRNRLGVQTAHALFSFMIYSHNLKKQQQINVPIWLTHKEDQMPFKEKRKSVEIHDNEIIECLELDNSPIFGDHDYENGMNFYEFYLQNTFTA